MVARLASGMPRGKTFGIGGIFFATAIAASNAFCGMLTAVPEEERLRARRCKNKMARTMKHKPQGLVHDSSDWSPAIQRRSAWSSWCQDPDAGGDHSVSWWPSRACRVEPRGATCLQEEKVATPRDIERPHITQGGLHKANCHRCRNIRMHLPCLPQWQNHKISF